MSNFIEEVKHLVNIQHDLDVEAAAVSIRKNCHFRGFNVWILAMAIVIASLGLNVNSTAVIIGAMLISPLMGPIIAFGLALGTNDITLMKIALRNLGVMVSISIIASTLFFFISPLNMSNPSELLARTNPTIYDVLIALFGGAAGALETSRKDKGTVISGVAIATALMPPLCTVGYGLANFNLAYVSGALYLFFINCVFVALATFLVVKYLHYPVVNDEDPLKQAKIRRWVGIGLVIIIVPSIISAITVIRENNFNSKAERFVASNKNIGNAIIYDYKTDPHADPATITIYVAGQKLTDSDKENIYASAEEVYGLGRYQIRIEESSTGGYGDFEKQVYGDLNATVEALRTRIRDLEAQKLPFSQISKEVLALYPQVQSAELAQGESDVFVIITYKEGVAESSSKTIGDWLKVRLAVSSIKVMEQFNNPVPQGVSE